MDSTVTMLTINAVLKLIVMGAVGFAAAKAGILDPARTGALSKILADIFLPMTVFNSLLKTYDPAKNAGYFFVLFGSAFLCVVMIIISTLIFPKKTHPEWATERNGAALTNAGFVGVPLLTLMGNGDALFYISGCMLVVNTLLWTYAVLCYSDEALSGESIKKILKNPTIIAIILGVIVYFGRIPLPALITGPVASIGACTGPVSMFVTGALLSRTNMLEIMKRKSAYVVLALRLLVMPLIAIFVAKLFNVPEDAKIALIIGAACPIVTLLPVLALQYDKDAKYATGMLSASMVLCMITIPAFIALYSMV